MNYEKSPFGYAADLDWPLCHCVMAQAPPSTNTGAPEMKCFEVSWKCCKVFCALVVTVKTCVLKTSSVF